MHYSNDNQVVPSRQQGFTLLLTMLVLLVGGASVYLSARNPAEARIAQALQKTSVGLRDAATALAVYSIGSDDRPGSMPCPDENSDGESIDLEDAGINDCPAYTSRLPWREVNAQRGAGRLWYVMDRDFRDHGGAEPINVALEGSLSLNGVGGFAALVIDPGDPLSGQTGRPGNDAADYLEGENADGDDEFYDCSGSDTCNDRVIGISVDQLMAVVQQRALAEVEQALERFHSGTSGESGKGFLPFAARFDGGSSCDIGVREGRVATSQGTCGSGNHLDWSDFPDWIENNEWLDHIVYSVDYQCSQAEMKCGDSAHELKSSDGLAVVLAGAGTERGGQNRTGSGRDIDDFLDSDENTDTDGNFDDVALSADDNDVLRGFSLPTEPAYP